MCSDGLLNNSSIGGFMPGLLGLDYKNTPMGLALSDVGTKVVCPTVRIRGQFAYGFGQFVRLALLVSGIGGVILYAVRCRFADPVAAGESPLHALIAIDHMLQRGAGYDDIVQFAATAGLPVKVAYAGGQFSSDSEFAAEGADYGEAAASEVDGERWNDPVVRETLSFARRVRVLPDGSGGFTIFPTGEDGKCAGCVEIPDVAILNAFPNIQEIDLSNVSLERSMDLCSLQHIKKFTGQDFRCENGVRLVPPASLEKVFLSGTGAFGLIDLRKCPRLREISLGSCGGQVNPLFDVKLPTNDDLQVRITSGWRNGLALRKIHQMMEGLGIPVVDAVWQPESMASVPELNKMGRPAADDIPYREDTPTVVTADRHPMFATAQSVNVRWNHSMGKFSIWPVDEGGKVGEIVRVDDLSILNDYPNIRKLNLRNITIENQSLNLRELRYITNVDADHFECKGRGWITLPRATKSATFANSSFEKIDWTDTCLERLTIGGSHREFCAHNATHMPVPGSNNLKIIITGKWSSDGDLAELRQQVKGWGANVKVVDNARCFRTDRERRALRRTTAIRIKNSDANGILEVQCFDGRKFRGLISISQEELNEYQNITRIYLLHGQQKKSLDLSRLRNTKDVICENFDMPCGGIDLGASVERVRMVRCLIRGGLGCSQCLGLKEVTIDSCDGPPGPNDQNRHFGSLIYPNGVPIKVHITGAWHTSRALDAVLAGYEAPNVQITNDATIQISEVEKVDRTRSQSSNGGYAKACSVLKITEEEGKNKSAVNRAYRVHMMKYHPDKNPGNAEAATKSAEIIAAHSIICQVNGWR
ncbi:MAG: DnaJ domain-containing protein [Puniceicoccales bacterium]|nr:DnaJ domain-containing protein [Puniceicoccales bacterium]